MKNGSRHLSHSFSLLIIFSMVLAPTAGFSSESEACRKTESFCSNTRDAIAQLIKDPKCKADASCVQCVGNTLGTSQMASYCTAYTSTSKSTKKQKIQTDVYLGTAIVCGTACGLISSGYGAALGQTLSKVCGGLGLAASGMELIMALAANDIAGAALGAAGQIGRAGKAIEMATAKVTKDIAPRVTSLKALSKVPACGSFALYGLLSAAKLASGKNMKKAKESQCDVVADLSKSADAAVQSCQIGKETTPQPSGQGAGMFAATAETFSAPTIDDGIKELGVTAADNFIKDMKDDLKLAEEKGKFNFADLAKRTDAGEDVGSLLGGTGAPAELLSAIVDGDARMKKGERFKALDDLGAGGYSASGSGTGLASTGVGSSELGFGHAGASPGGAAETLEIDRKPAAAASALMNDGDILHSAFSGSIFDIVSLRIKEQKGQYAEAEPEARMNRVFNGYSDRDRKPATKSSK